MARVRKNRICRRIAQWEDAVMRKRRRRRLRALIGAAVAAGCAAGAALAGSWDEKVFSSHVDFDAIAAAGAFGAARPDRARARTLQSQVHHRRRRRTAQGDAGDRADQAQVRRQPGVHANQRPGLQFLLRLPQRSRRSAAPAISSPTSSSPKVLKARSSIRPILHFRASAIPFRSSAPASSNFWRAR